ncbi:MAG: transposase [Syntrophomonadaceae bacterium]|nr:transposase [Syntrophomonadaceae bacterium]
MKKKGISITDAADVLRVLRSRFYKHSRLSGTKHENSDRPKYISDQELSAAIRIAGKRYPLYGYRRIRAILQREFQIKAGLNRVNRIMNKLALSQHRIKNRRIVQMKNRPSQPDGPNQVWEMDMTKTYLPALMDTDGSISLLSLPPRPFHCRVRNQFTRTGSGVAYCL